MIYRRLFRLRWAVGPSVIALGALVAASVFVSTGVAGTDADGVGQGGGWEYHTRQGASGDEATPIPREAKHGAEAGEPARIFIHPARARVLAGQQVLFTAVAVDEAGAPVMDAEIRWTVSDDLAGGVDAFGLFTAGRVQGMRDAAVVASAGDGGGRIASSATVEVTESLPGEVRTLDRIVPYSSSVTVRADRFIGFAALAWDDRQRWVRDVDMEWSLVDDRAGEIDRFGFFTASALVGTYPDAVRVEATQRTGGVILRREAFVTVTVAEQVRDNR